MSALVDRHIVAAEREVARSKARFAETLEELRVRADPRILVGEQARRAEQVVGSAADAGLRILRTREAMIAGAIGLIGLIGFTIFRSRRGNATIASDESFSLEQE